jgi:hypothetical protein
MILYTNGCSFTAGGGLEPILNPKNNPTQDDFYKEYVWAKHLGDKIGVEKIINHSRKCGSNHRILRTTFDFLSQTEYNYEDIIVGIQFTNNNRFEFYDSNYKNLEKHWKQVKVGRNESNFEEHDLLIKETEFTDMFLTKYQNTSIQDSYDTLFLLNTMQNILEKFDIKKYFFWSEKNWHFNYTTETNYFIKKHLPFLLIDKKMGVDYLKCAHPSL